MTIYLHNFYPDHTLMTKVLREQMQWQTALESTLLETSKLKHEYKLAKQKIFELQQENIIKIEHSRYTDYHLECFMSFSKPH